MVGAYQGIYLRDLARAFARCGLGAIELFVLDRGSERIFTQSLADGYYLVLVAERSVPVGLAHHHLTGAALQLRDLL